MSVLYYILFGLSLTGEMLTVYQFCVHIFTLSVIILIYNLHQRKYRPIVIGAGVILAAIGLYYLIHPSFIQEMTHTGEPASRPFLLILGAFWERFTKSLRNLSRFFPYQSGFIVLIVIFNLFHIKKTGLKGFFSRGEDSKTKTEKKRLKTFTLLTGAVNLTVFLLLYYTFRLPRNAIYVEQFCFVWPFAAILMAFLITKINKKIVVGNIIFTVILFITGGFFSYIFYIEQVEMEDLKNFRKPYAFISDFSRRGHALRLAYHAPEGSRIYIPERGNLTAKEMLDISTSLRNDHTVFFLIKEDKNKSAFRKKEDMVTLEIIDFKSYSFRKRMK